MRLSRPCYDKPRRCPGWAGGGFHYAKIDHCPDGGDLHMYEPGWEWKFFYHKRCGTLVIPWVLRWASPSYITHRLMWKLSDWRYERKWK